MASRTAASTVKRKNKHEKAGRRRKNRLARKSTKSVVESIFCVIVLDAIFSIIFLLANV